MSDTIRLGTQPHYSQTRDAIHVAVVPVTADEDLQPGSRVGLVKQGRVSRSAECIIGIIDPFLKKPVEKNARCYLLLLPNTVQGMRHHWQHPAFSDSDSIVNDSSKSKEWISNYAAGLGVSYDDLMNAAESYIEHGDYWNEGDRFDGVYLDNVFWDHFQAVTGKFVDDKSSFFSCSC